MADSDKAGVFREKMEAGARYSDAILKAAKEMVLLQQEQQEARARGDWEARNEKARLFLAAAQRFNVLCRELETFMSDQAPPISKA